MTFTVALVGGDGAGKTTIAKELEASADPVACRYVYMGQSVLSSDRALPTSRLARAAKVRTEPPPKTKTPGVPKKRRSRLRVAASLANRTTEAAWRRVLVWRATRQGLVVISDRHFLFEAATYAGEPGTGGDRFDRFEYWVMRRLGRPDLVIFLDASPEVMHARKGETSIRRLARRRAAIVAQGERTPNFVRVDADQAYEDVLAIVRATIASFASSRGHAGAARA